MDVEVGQEWRERSTGRVFEILKLDGKNVRVEHPASRWRSWELISHLVKTCDLIEPKPGDPPFAVDIPPPVEPTDDSVYLANAIESIQHVVMRRDDMDLVHFGMPEGRSMFVTVRHLCTLVAAAERASVEGKQNA